MARILVLSTLIPASLATSISCPTALMSCPIFVFLNQIMTIQRRAMRMMVRNGIVIPPAPFSSANSLMDQKLSMLLRTFRRSIVFLTP